MVLVWCGIGRRCTVLVWCGRDTHFFGCEDLALRVDPLTPVGIGTSCMVLVWCGGDTHLFGCQVPVLQRI